MEDYAFDIFDALDNIEDFDFDEECWGSRGQRTERDEVNSAGTACENESKIVSPVRRKTHESRGSGAKFSPRTTTFACSATSRRSPERVSVTKRPPSPQRCAAGSRPLTDGGVSGL